jgi:hypothetical protein
MLAPLPPLARRSLAGDTRMGHTYSVLIRHGMHKYQFLDMDQRERQGSREGLF